MSVENLDQNGHKITLNTGLCRTGWAECVRKSCRRSSLLGIGDEYDAEAGKRVCLELRELCELDIESMEYGCSSILEPTNSACGGFRGINITSCQWWFKSQRTDCQLSFTPLFRWEQWGVPTKYKL